MIKILKSLAMIATVGALAIGGTYAWDLQTEKITDVTFGAASADLKIDSNLLSNEQTWVDGFGFPNDLFPAALAPGAKDDIIVNIKNVGSANGTASVRLDLKSNKENDRLSPEIQAGDTTDGDWGGELAQKMRVKISYKEETDSSFTEKYNFTLAEYEANPNMLNLGAIGFGTGDDSNMAGVGNVKFEWEVPANAGNKIMTDSVTLDVIFGLE